MPTFDLRTGNTLELLRGMPSGFVQCVVTSPPYYGLRDYGIEPDVWGGEEGCAHDWDVTMVAAASQKGGNWQQAENGNGLRTGRAHTRFKGDTKEAGRQTITEVKTGFCMKCGAWLGTLGLEPTPQLYVEHMVLLFREVRRVLRDDGTLWLNLGDSFANDTKWGGRSGQKNGSATNGGYSGQRARRSTGFKPKDLMLMPHRVAIALQDDGWWVRMDNVWSKPSCLPESVDDRPTKAHEYVFLLTKSPAYFYDRVAVEEAKAASTVGDGRANGNGQRRERGFPGSASNGGTNLGGPDGGRNLRSVWTISPRPFPEAHFATFPPDLPDLCVRAGTSEMGCCSKCGAPWERVVTKKSVPQEDVSPERGVKGAPGQKPMDDSNGWEGFPRGTTYSQTDGWRPTCGCHGEQFEKNPTPPPGGIVRPCVVLDPFNGAGTTGLAALRLGRDYVGHERGGKYVEMTRRRLTGDCAMFYAEGRLY